MNKLLFISILLSFLIGCKSIKNTKPILTSKEEDTETIVDTRDNNRYLTVVIGDNKWFKENLRYESPQSKCYKNKKANCDLLGRLYPSSELETICPDGWRVPTIDDWNTLKNQFDGDSITALLDVRCICKEE